MICVEDDFLLIEYGGLLCMVVFGKYFYKSFKWFVEIEFFVEDWLGYWEVEIGYYNYVDFWVEE